MTEEKYDRRIVDDFDASPAGSFTPTQTRMRIDDGSDLFTNPRYWSDVEVIDSEPASNLPINDIVYDMALNSDGVYVVNDPDVIARGLQTLLKNFDRMYNADSDKIDVDRCTDYSLVGFVTSHVNMEFKNESCGRIQITTTSDRRYNSSDEGIVILDEVSSHTLGLLTGTKALTLMYTSDSNGILANANVVLRYQSQWISGSLNPEQLDQNIDFGSDVIETLASMVAIHNFYSEFDEIEQEELKNVISASLEALVDAEEK